MGKKSKTKEEEVIENIQEDSSGIQNKMLRKKPWS
jgi:hypothetical protein